MSKQDELIQLKKSNRWYYSFDKDTGIYLSSGLAQIDQIELKLIYPPNTTTIKPPKHSDLEDAYFIEKDKKWTLKESDKSRKEKLKEKNADGIYINKIDANSEVAAKTQAEIDDEIEETNKIKVKKAAMIDLENMMNVMLERSVMKHALAGEKEEIERLRDIVNS